MKADKNIFEKAVKSLKHSPFPSGPDRQTVEATKAAAAKAAGLPLETLLEKQTILERIKFMNFYSKLAAAAAVIVVLLIGTYWLGTPIDGTSLALANVMQKIEQVKNSCFKFETLVTGYEKDTRVQAYYSRSDGYRTDVFDGNNLLSITYVLPGEKRVVNITPAKQTCNISQILKRSEEPNEPEDVITNIKQTIETCIDENAKSLGTRDINGIEAEGFEIEGPNGMNIVDSRGVPINKSYTRIWIDVKTELPVMIEKESSTADGASRVQMTWKFEWNVDLDKSIFEPNIPKDYTIHND
jgi:outer membrane lipoprotein-sorting protein